MYTGWPKSLDRIYFWSNSTAKSPTLIKWKAIKRRESGIFMWSLNSVGSGLIRLKQLCKPLFMMVWILSSIWSDFLDMWFQRMERCIQCGGDSFEKLWLLLFDFIQYMLCVHNKNIYVPSSNRVVSRMRFWLKDRRGRACLSGMLRQTPNFKVSPLRYVLYMKPTLVYPRNGTLCRPMRC